MKQNKSELRKQLKLARSELSRVDTESKSSKIIERLKKAIDWAKVHSAHVYLPIESNKEVNTWDLLHWIWVQYPALETSTSVYGESRSLRHVVINPKTKFEKDSLGIPIPIADYKLQDTEYDIVIIPVLGFDDELNRIGYGQGVYDSFLAKYPKAQKIGLAYEIARLKNVPTEMHDEPLSMIITEYKHSNLDN